MTRHAATFDNSLILSGFEGLDAGAVGRSRPSFPLVLWAIWALDLAAVVLATVAAVIIGVRPDAFFGEGQFITIVSSLHLIAASGVSVAILHARVAGGGMRIWRSPRLLWLFVAVGCALLAVDETAQIHERVDHWIHQALGLAQNPWSDRIDDLIVLLYGLTGLAVLWICRREIRCFKSVRPLLGLALSLFGVMVLFDVFTNSYTSSADATAMPQRLATLAGLANVGEETCKLLSEGAIVAAFAGVLSVAQRRSSGSGSERCKR